MALTKTQVFIASNFEEFGEIRTRLKHLIDSSAIPVEAIDLSDNRPSSHSPLERSLESISQAEVLVLLLGKTYGGLPPGETRSYAHLEYCTACEIESGPSILPFFLGPNLSAKDFQFSTEERLGAFQEEVLRRHTVSFLDIEKLDAKTMASVIFSAVEATLWDLLSGEQQESVLAMEVDPDIGSLQASGLSSQEIEYLQDRFEDASTMSETPSTGIEVLRNPARTAAQEQLVEARKAIELAERSVAVVHLRRAVEARPLDSEASYWLGRFLLASGRRRNVREAFVLARRAANLAEHAEQRLRASLAFVLAAQAAAKLDDLAGGLKLARRAVEHVPELAAAHVELAAQHAHQGDLQSAFKEARNAFFCQPASIFRVEREPVFRSSAGALRVFKKKLRDEICEQVKRILKTEAALIEELPYSETQSEKRELVEGGLSRVGDLDLMSLLKLGRDSCASHLEVLRESTAGGEGLVKELEALMVERKRAASRRFHAVLIGPLVIGTIIMTTAVALGWAGQAWLWAWLLVGTGVEISRYYRFRIVRSKHVGAISRREAELEAALKRGLRVFIKAVGRFERACLRWGILSPVPSLKGAEGGGIVRFDPGRQEEKIFGELDLAPLPPELRELVGTWDEGEGYRLVSLLQRVDGGWRGSRWRAYWK